MKAAWAKRKAQAKEVYADAWQREADAIEAELETAEDSNPVATHLENELRRRDKELLAEWKNQVANVQPNRILGAGLIVPWSTVDAILKALPTE